MSASEGYARPELLAEPDWLWARRDDPGMRIIDCANIDRYTRAHIPGAAHRLLDDGEALVAEGSWIKDPVDPAHVVGPDAVAAFARKLGISDDTTVVAYDDYNGTFATRLWWVLAYYGHADAKVLNGGWQRWLDEGRPATFRKTVPEPGHFTPRPNEAMRVRLDELRTRHAEPGVQVVNVLWPEVYAGMSNPFGNKRAGHIPASVNLPIEQFLVDQDVPVIKPAVDLRDVLRNSGLSPDKDTIVHCQAGIRTTMGVFALSLLGWDRVRAYEASMAEWANRDDTPLSPG